MGIARPGILSYHANALESLAELEQVVRGGVPPSECNDVWRS